MGTDGRKFSLPTRTATDSCANFETMWTRLRCSYTPTYLWETTVYVKLHISNDCRAQQSQRRRPRRCRPALRAGLRSTVFGGHTLLRKDRHVVRIWKCSGSKRLRQDPRVVSGRQSSDTSVSKRMYTIANADKLTDDRPRCKGRIVCPSVLLSFCLFVFLSFCPFVLLSFCPFYESIVSLLSDPY